MGMVALKKCNIHHWRLAEQQKEEATDTFGVDPLEEMHGATDHAAPFDLVRVYYY